MPNTNNMTRGIEKGTKIVPNSVELWFSGILKINKINTTDNKKRNIKKLNTNIIQDYQILKRESICLKNSYLIYLNLA